MSYSKRIFFILIALIVIVPSAFSQKFDRIERDRLKEMLDNIKNTIKKNYYDPAYHGIDLDARFQKAHERLDAVTSTGQGFGVIAQVLVDFNDSHLYFIPPGTTVEVQYGFRMQMVGDKALITAVKPKSDAEAKGLKAGDQVMSFENFRPNRKELWKLNFYYYVLSPRGKLRLSVLHPGAAEPVDIEFAAKIKQKPQTRDLEDTLDLNELIRDSDASRDAHYIAERGDTVIWKMLTFADDPARINSLMDSRGKKGKNLILDLRGNGGGYVESLELLAGHFFDRDMKIADRKGRPEKKKENQPSMLKGRKDYFQGKLIVLIDHESGSASEIFARLMQLEKRGVVLGDVSAGAVMQSIGHPLTMVAGIEKEIGYEVSVTNADIIMSDGKSVEHVGVTPDELILPTAEDIREGRDPVLARAMEILGQKMSPQEAYKLFEKAYKWNDN